MWGGMGRLNYSYLYFSSRWNDIYSNYSYRSYQKSELTFDDFSNTKGLYDG